MPYFKNILQDSFFHSQKIIFEKNNFSKILASIFLIIFLPTLPVDYDNNIINP
jgi:hypothetical protein